MRTTSFVLILTLGIFRSTFSEDEQVFKVSGLDSYLEAYRESQERYSDNSVNDVEGGVKKSDRLFNEWHGYPNPQPPYNGYGPEPQ